jgi:hypothetical protein
VKVTAHVAGIINTLYWMIIIMITVMVQMDCSVLVEGDVYVVNVIVKNSM